MMDPNTYWDWYWTNAYYSLIIGGPIMVLGMVGFALWEWLQDREEETDRKEHIQTLFKK